jgi:hypothetical protein
VHLLAFVQSEDGEMAADPPVPRLVKAADTRVLLALEDRLRAWVLSSGRSQVPAFSNLAEDLLGHTAGTPGSRISRMPSG